MSPASSGPLEVERYIGACLISSQHRVKPGNELRDYYSRDKYQPPNIYSGYQDNRYRHRRCNSDGWAGGMPLISFANNHRWNRQENQPPKTDDSMPLSRLAVHTQGVPLILSGRHNNRRNKKCVTPQVRPLENKKETNRPVDSISVASDESSGSNASETSLPRIIKPRKRRKKDRKPHGTRQEVHQENVCDSADSSPNIVTLKPYVVPFCYTRYRVPQNYVNIESSNDDSELSEAPILHHKFEDVVGLENDLEQQVTSCQCRYCDPAGQIWDVDRHCYSPFLTRQDQPFDFSKKFLADKISLALENQCLISSNSKEEVKRTSQCLEISTEIVTSHNGHRDLEIRLFSSLGSRSTADKCGSGERLCAVSDSTLLPEE